MPKNQINEHLDLVLFDLDDTLVPVKMQIALSIQALMSFVEKNMPKSLNDIKSNLQATMIR